MYTVTNKDLQSPGILQISPGRVYIMADLRGRPQREFEFPMLFEIAAIVFCKNGSTKLTINDKQITLNTGDFLFVSPDSVLDSADPIDEELEISIVMISSAERFRSVVIDRQLWNVMLQLRRNPVVHLTKKDNIMVSSFRSVIFLLLESYKSMPYTEKVLNSLTDAFFFQFLNILSSKAEYSKIDLGRVPGQRIFLEFLDKLKEGDGKYRSVDQMASSLCVSPKYLARLVKENSGMTPSDWMDEYTMRAIVRELRFTDKPMKDIASTMGFPNPSSFGTFFRRHMGTSPAAYRTQAQS